MIINVYDLLDVYNNEVSKNTKNKRKVYNFEKHKMIHLYNIKNKIENNKYEINNYNIFNIYEPKLRIIMSLSIENRIVDHYLSKYILLPKLDKYLDIRNVASRKNMGMSYGVKLLKKYIEKNKKYDNIYVLKIDISKYFYSIDHNVLKRMLLGKLNNDEYNLVSKFIDSTDYDYVNKRIEEIKNKLKTITTNSYKLNEIDEIPYYLNGKGLTIGNVSSQILSIFYLSELDFYIINNLKCKYMIRYCDDIIILHNDREYLYEVFENIKEKIGEYKLRINTKKSFITRLDKGVIFCGNYIKIDNKKTIINKCNVNKIRIKRNIKKINKKFIESKISYKSYFNSINCYRSMKF